MSTVSSTAASWTQGLLLPTTAVPRRYDLALAVDLEAWRFAGTVDIALTITHTTAHIVAHSFELTYPNREGEAAPDVRLFTASAGKAADPLQWACAVETDDAASQRVRFSFKDEIAAGEYVLRVRFDGILNDQLAGFYRSAYTSARDGKPKFMAVTQFEATDCRRAIPCWDEPAIKAVFAVTLIAESTQCSVSNMPVTRASTILGTAAEQKADPACRGLVVPRGWVRYEYADSPVMSSYLLAFIIGEFDYISAFTVPVAGVEGSGRVELRIYTPVGQTKQGEFAMDVALKCLKLYEEFFQLPYPLPKLDLLAIPDFASGAMENWGAITYRDTMLLIDPDQSSALIKQRCAKTIAHEIAHMWFGNLVTMQWWSTLWLNEGFARYCESWAVDCIFPDWEVMAQFINEVYGVAQSMDSLESSHAVELSVSTPEEINEIFDPISYNKGASLIRMLLETIGAEAFRLGLQIYLRQHAYKNTTSVDLWNSFSAATKQIAERSGSGVAIDIRALMEQWVVTVGYPVLSIEETSAPPTKAQSACRCFAITQSKFLQSGAPAAAAASSSSNSPATTWSVPLAIGAYSLSSVKTIAITHRILNKLNGVVEVDAVAADVAGSAGKELQTIYSFNHAATGFYRVLYAPELFNALSTLVSKQLLPPLDRLSLLRDCYSLSACGQGYTVAHLLDLLLLFEHERSFVLVQFLSIVLAGLANLHQGASYFPSLQRLIAKLFAARWAELGWGPAPGAVVVKKEHHLTFLERAILLQMEGSFGGGEVSAAIQERSFELLRDFIADPVAKPIQPDLRAPVYALAIKARGQAARDLLLQLYRSDKTSNEEKVRVLSSLGTTRGLASTVESDSADIRNLLVWIFSTHEVRSGDLIYVLSSIGTDSKLARTLCWQHMQANWDALLSKFKGAMFVLGRIFPAVIGEMSSEEECREFEAWFATHPVPGAERAVKQCSETVRMKAGRLAREAPIVQQWCEKNASKL